MTRAQSIAVLVTLVATTVFFIMYGWHKQTACERTGGRYLCKSRTSCDCYHGCRL